MQFLGDRLELIAHVLPAQRPVDPHSLKLPRQCHCELYLRVKSNCEIPGRIQLCLAGDPTCPAMNSPRFKRDSTPSLRTEILPLRPPL